MDQHEDLRRWRLAQRELLDEEVAIRTREWETKASRRLVGLVQQSNAVHRGMRSEHDNIQVLSKFYHVAPPPPVKVRMDVQGYDTPGLMEPLTHGSILDLGRFGKSSGNPSQAVELGLHKGIAEKYKQQFGVTESTTPYATFKGMAATSDLKVAPDLSHEGKAPSEAEQKLLEFERARPGATPAPAPPLNNQAPATSSPESGLTQKPVEPVVERPDVALGADPSGQLPVLNREDFAQEVARAAQVPKEQPEIPLPDPYKEDPVDGLDETDNVLAHHFHDIGLIRCVISSVSKTLSSTDITKLPLNQKTRNIISTFMVHTLLEFQGRTQAANKIYHSIFASHHL